MRGGALFRLGGEVWNGDSHFDCLLYVCLRAAALSDSQVWKGVEDAGRGISLSNRFSPSFQPLATLRLKCPSLLAPCYSPPLSHAPLNPKPNPKPYLSPLQGRYLPSSSPPHATCLRRRHPPPRRHHPGPHRRRHLGRLPGGGTCGPRGGSGVGGGCRAALWRRTGAGSSQCPAHS